MSKLEKRYEALFLCPKCGTDKTVTDVMYATTLMPSGPLEDKSCEVCGHKWQVRETQDFNLERVPLA